MSASDDRPLDRSTADQVLRRALEIDAQRADALTEAQLREIAAEMSVSPLALEQALAELRAGSAAASGMTMAVPSASAGLYWRAGAGVSLFVLLGTLAAVASRLFP